MVLEATAAFMGRIVRDHAAAVVVVTLLATLGFGAALVSIPSTPSSDAFEMESEAQRAERKIRDILPPRGFPVPFLVESRVDGESVLTRVVFDEILAREDAMRNDPVLQPLLYTYVDPNLRMEVSSVWSLPDTLRATMNGETPLSYAIGWRRETGGPGVPYDRASDAEFQDALDRLLSFEVEDGSAPFQRALSQDVRKEGNAWRARSIFVTIYFDHALLFDRYARDPALATPAQPLFEEAQLHALALGNAGATETRWWGVGLGINLEIRKEVSESARLVAGALAVIAVVLYATLRNVRDSVIAFLSLPLLIVWMTGGARLLGLSDNQFTAMLPVLILALGVDYAIHGASRYRQERGTFPPGEAVRRSIALLGPALLLACGTTAVAFLSNAFSSVEALAHWGIEGGFAIVSALWLSGVFAPAIRYLWDGRRVARRKIGTGPRESVASRRGERGTVVGKIAVWTARRPRSVLVAVALLTLPATYLALGIETTFAATDFFDDRSDFIQALSRVSRDFPDEGEPALLLVEGDVSDPRVLAALDEALRELKRRGYAPEMQFAIPTIVRAFTSNPGENGVTYADADRDGIPDSPGDVRDLLARALRDGVYTRAPAPPEPIAPGAPLLPPPLSRPGTERVLAYSKETVRELVHPTDDGGYDATLAYVGIPDTDDFTNIPVALANVEEAAAGLHALEGGAVERWTLTGEPIKRYEMVGAITESLKISVTLSVVLCFGLIFLAFRDLRYSLITILPVVLLVPWLYGFMSIVGLSLNLVTATIAAMSIGVGVDYSLHLAERFREEHHRNGRTPEDSLRVAADSTGVALLGSVATTILGFLVLLLAPMPLFRTFGLLTAAMAGASFLAAATVLPPLLVLAASSRPAAKRVPVEPVPGSPAAVEEPPVGAR